MTELVSRLPRDHYANLMNKWSDFGPPLAPSPDDTAVVQRLIAALPKSPNVVVLGLTPQTIGCHWPVDTVLSAVDHSPAMMQELWPPEKGPPGAQAVLADWGAMPIASDSIDLVAGDGCYIALSYPDQCATVTREVGRVLRPGGKFVIRVFLRPDNKESVEEIAAGLRNRQIGSVHALKLRLHAALHGANEVGTRLDDVWQAWRSMLPLPDGLAERPGWTAPAIAGIEAYRGRQARYYLPKLAEFRGIVSCHFLELDCAIGDYELAARCPTFVLQRR